jgi:hypothetical protein
LLSSLVNCISMMKVFCGYNRCWIWPGHSWNFIFRPWNDAKDSSSQFGVSDDDASPSRDFPISKSLLIQDGAGKYTFSSLHMHLCFSPRWSRKDSED